MAKPFNEFAYQGETILRPGGCATFTAREYVVWSGVGDDAVPVDRFDVFRRDRRAPWVAWCSDTLSASKARRRRAFARLLNWRERREAAS